MTEFDQPEQSQSRAQTQITQDHLLYNQQGTLPDFDLDTYHHLFSQDLPHSASSSLELDYSQFNNNSTSFQTFDSITTKPSSLSLSSTNSSSSTSSSSVSSSGPPNQTSCLSSPSWSSLDQLFLASLPLHPQSSPLFPLDLIPNSNSVLEPTHDQPVNQLNNLSDFSFDAHLHDWNLSFDPVYSSSSAENLQECKTPLHSSENDSHQIAQPVFLQEEGTSPSEQYFKDPTRPTVEGQEYGDFLLSSINTGPINFTSPPPRQSTPYTPVLPMKRMRSSYSQVEDGASPLGIADLSSVTYNNSIPVEQLIQADKEAIIQQNHSLQPKLKRLKTRTASSISKTHICQECGKSFPRLTSLTQHKLTHNGERPFPCGFEGCSKSFTTSSNMKRHWKTHV